MSVVAVACSLQPAVVALLALSEQREEIVVQRLVAAQVHQFGPVGVGMAEVAQQVGFHIPLARHDDTEYLFFG